MRFLVTLIFLLLSVGPGQAQTFSRGHSSGAQPALSQPLQWVSAPSVAGPNLPDTFFVNPKAWTFAPYLANTVLPTTTGQDVWLKFTLAATATQQSWIIRIPRLTIRRVSLYDLNGDGFLAVQSAGASIAHSSWTRDTRTPSFEVISGKQDKTFFLRFEHHSPVTDRPEMMTQADFADGASQVGALLGLIVGMFGMLLVACIAAFAMARKTVFLSLAALIAASLLFYGIQMGYGSWRIWTNSVYVTEVMQWSAPLIVMATGCWFFAQASHAKDISRPVYRILCMLALVSVGLALFRFISVDLIPRDWLNAWAVFVLLTLFTGLLWVTLRGMYGNLWLLAGLLLIAAAGASRLAYSFGWLAHIEFATVVSVFLTKVGLGLLFATMLFRNRAALLSSELAVAMNDTDPTSGLIVQRAAMVRLPQMLGRASQLKLGCGVIMLRWLNHAQLMHTLNPEKQKAMLKFLGHTLNRVARDIDTAAELQDGYFMILIEGPISRSTLSSLSTQILTACIRASDKFGEPNPFNFHIAIWQATLVPISADEVMEALKTRLNQMSFGTKRPVQFVDAASSDQSEAQRRDDLVAKIDAIEASSSMRAILAPVKSAK